MAIKKIEDIASDLDAQWKRDGVPMTMTMLKAREVIGLADSTIRAAIKDGSLRATQIRTHYRILRMDLARFFAEGVPEKKIK